MSHSSAFSFPKNCVGNTIEVSWSCSYKCTRYYQLQKGKFIWFEGDKTFDPDCCSLDRKSTAHSFPTADIPQRYLHYVYVGHDLAPCRLLFSKDSWTLNKRRRENATFRPIIPLDDVTGVSYPENNARSFILLLPQVCRLALAQKRSTIGPACTELGAFKCALLLWNDYLVEMHHSGEDIPAYRSRFDRSPRRSVRRIYDLKTIDFANTPSGGRRSTTWSRIPTSRGTGYNGYGNGYNSGYNGYNTGYGKLVCSKLTFQGNSESCRWPYSMVRICLRFTRRDLWVVYLRDWPRYRSTI